MQLYPMKTLLDEAVKGKYAVGAFNTNTLEYSHAILEAANELNSPVIIQAAPQEMMYMGAKTFVNMVKSIIEDKNIKVPVTINLDHGSTYADAMIAINAGFTGLMIDASKQSFLDNIKETKKVVEAAHSVGISVEAELGKIGGTDELTGEKGDMDVQDDFLINPDDAKEFVEKTNIDCLAAAIGTAHGLYKFAPKLDFNRLEKTFKLTGIPIVMHGGTGVPREDILKAISYGVGKINFSTVVRQACIGQLHKTLKEYPDELDLMFILGKSKDKMKEAVKNQILMCGSNNKA